jgi:hypothetical protein
MVRVVRPVRTMGAMTPPDGWQPLSEPSRRSGPEAFHLSPFARLARAHFLSICGDALVVLALADSLFFSIPSDDARWRVFLYLALTMAPFAVVAPLIGPALDRAAGGRRWMVVGANAVRAVVCVFMINDLDSLLLFPQAFTILVMGKGYGVARSALVPTVVRTDNELVEANSKLQLLSGIGAVVAAIPGVLAILIAGSQGALVIAALTFTAATLAALRIPKTQVSAEPADEAEKAELRGLGILLAASAMGLIRGIVGFLTFLLAFELRGADAPAWHFGVVLAVTAAGGLAGAALAPVLRRSTTEERMLMITLGLIVATGVATAYAGGVLGAAILGAAVAVGSTAGKLAFDSLVQRDAPDANRGRSFARFETRFQLIWVAGAVLPTVVPIPAQLGFLVVAGAAGFALFSYVAGQKAAHRSIARRPPAGPGAPGRGGAPEAPPAPEVQADVAHPEVPDPWGLRSTDATFVQGGADPIWAEGDGDGDGDGDPPGRRRPPVDPTELQ